MDRRRNPFVPGAGLQPPELAGRDRLLADASIDMDRVLAGRPTKGLILLGLRGAGKTVLLNRLRGLADDKGFHTVRIEAPEGSSLPELLTPELRRTIYALDLRQAASQHLRRAASVLANFAKAFKVSAGDLELSVDLAPGEGDTGNLEQDLPRLLVAMAEAAADRHTAVGLFIDEVQYLSSVELAAVIVACHEIAQRNLPFLFTGAGLPQVAALAGKAKSYAGAALRLSGGRAVGEPGRAIGPGEAGGSRRRVVRRRRGGGDSLRRSELPVFHPGMGFPGLERGARKPDYQKHGSRRDPGRDLAPGQQLLSGSLRPADTLGTEVPAGHGRAGPGALRHGANRRNPGRPGRLRRDGAPTPHQQGDGVESAARGDVVHGPDVRRLHEAPDAGLGETRDAAPFRTMKPRASLTEFLQR